MTALAATVMAVPARRRRARRYPMLALDEWAGPALVVPWEPWIGRFLIKITVTEEGCWRWTGTRSNGRYAAALGPDGKKTGAHRLAYMVLTGPIPTGYEVDHLCFTRDCVNPSHLEAVTPQENVRRREARRQTCRFGHPLAQGKSQRFCRTCDNDSRRAKRAAAKSASASASVTGGPPPAGALADGVSGRVPPPQPEGQDGDSTSVDSNRSPAVNEGPAEGATALAREQV